MGKSKDLKQRQRRSATAAELARKKKKREKKKEDEKKVAMLAKKKATSEWQAKYWRAGSGVDDSARGIDRESDGGAEEEDGTRANDDGVDEDVGNESDMGANDGGDEDGHVGNEGNEDAHVGNEIAPDTLANDEDIELLVADDDKDYQEDLTGVMQLYLRALTTRLQREVTGDLKASLEERWLMRHLKDNDFWIRSVHAPLMYKKLGMIPRTTDDYHYIVDVKFWLPDVQWGPEAMPCCPTCKSSKHVKPHGFRDNHFGRRVTEMHKHYFIQSRRHICGACKLEANLAADEQYTFMAWNQESLARMPYGYGEEFPAFFTWRGGVDCKVIDIMRPLFNKGVRPETLAMTMQELHMKTWTDKYIRRENDLMRDVRLDPDKPRQVGMFSGFADKSKYAGMVPSGRYLQSVFVAYEESIEWYYELETKKRGAKRIHIDCHYKEAKHLGRYHGHKLWEGLVTITNEFGEIRSQFHVTSDSHEQLRPPIEAMLDTMKQYGQDLPGLATSDRPFTDKPFLLELIPSLQLTQHEFDELLRDFVPTTDNENPTTDNENNLQECTFDEENITIVSGAAEINLRIDAIDELMRPQGGRYVYQMDAEWERHERIALITLGYEVDGTKKVLGMRFTTVASRVRLPERLLALFEDELVAFAGVNIKADLKKVGKDFNCLETATAARGRAIELGVMARKRDVVKGGGCGLKELVARVLNQKMEKATADTFSKWTQPHLTGRQKKYAALDVIKAWEVYEKLLELPDLTLRISVDQARQVGLRVDIVPSSGDVASMATRAAIGRVVADEYWTTPGKKAKKITSSQVMVEIEQVLGPALRIPRLKENGEKLSLGHFGETPFKIALPRRMVKPHVASPSVRVYTPSHSQGDATHGCEVEEGDDLQTIHDPEQDPDFSEEMAARSINLTTRALAAGTIQQDLPLPFENEIKLDPPPSRIDDTASSVLGCGFHTTDRPKTPVRHEVKKSYHVAYQNALYCWDENILEGVKDVLRQDGVSDDDMASIMYYNADFFKACTPRVILPPTLLYWRVRAVFRLYGPVKDSKTGRPLFNDEAWKKARNVLNEILLGYISDPPGVEFYFPKLNKHGQQMVNKYGIPLLLCNRSNSHLEGMHKQLVDSFSTWCTGGRMGSCLLGEFRHRYTQGMSERRRPGFPNIGHYDTWKVDLLQRLVLRNHGKILYPGWVNTSDFLPTPEKFGTVALQSQELTDALNAIELAGNFKLSPELEHLSKTSGTKLPFLPVHWPEEKKLFFRLALQQSGNFDADEMAVMWVKYVDGIKIFPKTPAQLRVHRKRFETNRRIRDAVKRIGASIAELSDINSATCPNTMVTRTSVADQPPQAEQLILPGDAMPATGTVVMNRFRELPSWALRSRVPAMLVPVLPVVPAHARLLRLANTTLMPIDAAWHSEERRVRGPDKRRRLGPRCTRCCNLGFSDHEARACPAAHAKSKRTCPR